MAPRQELLFISNLDKHMTKRLRCQVLKHAATFTNPCELTTLLCKNEVSYYPCPERGNMPYGQTNQYYRALLLVEMALQAKHSLL